MVRVIMGVKGTGKTKQMIELINSAVHSENGNVVCIERGPKLTYDIHYKIRLVEASHYDIKSYDFLKGFISGLYAGNYDITHVFIDSLTKIVASEATDHALMATTLPPALMARSTSSQVRTSKIAVIPSDSMRSSSASNRACSKISTCSGTASAP